MDVRCQQCLRSSQELLHRRHDLAQQRHLGVEGGGVGSDKGFEVACAALLVHQTPELLPRVTLRSQHWRESYFFDIHSPDGQGDVIFFTMAHYPARELMDSLQMGRVNGESVTGFLARPYDGDPHTT